MREIIEELEKLCNNYQVTSEGHYYIPKEELDIKIIEFKNKVSEIENRFNVKLDDTIYL